MKEIFSKMTELKFEAPLAQFEEADEWQNNDYRRKHLNARNNEMRRVEKGIHASVTVGALDENDQGVGEEDDRCVFDDNEEEYDFTFSEDGIKNMHQRMTIVQTETDVVNNNVLGDNFAAVSGSLEDLVNTFDEKITRCFHNFRESVENLAPVQVRSQEEIMNECQ